MKPRYVPLFVIMSIILSSYMQKGKRKKNKYLPKYFVEIPAGYLWDHQNYDSLNIWVNPKSVKDSTEVFSISETEVSNRQYQYYLQSLKRKGQIDDFNKALPDTTVWRDLLAYNEPFVQYYFRHKAYKNYPLVGVTQKQAFAYCDWLSDSLTRQNSEVSITIKLPTRNQWIRAARGDNKNQSYAMEGPKLRNKNGLYLYNHKVVGEQNIYMNKTTKQYHVIRRSSMIHGDLEDGALVTTEVQSYWPNQFGTYNMCGNVAELILDDSIALGGSWYDPGFDIRIESEKNATKPTSTIGFRVVAIVSENQ